MLLKNVFIRFYKSFNFDYMRKFHKEAKPRPWEYFSQENLWYPHVTIPLDPLVTTIVGANESGKSQLLSAIENIERSDFCRYSKFFAVERGEMVWPEFGFEWELNDTDREKLKDIIQFPNRLENAERLLVFRTNCENLTFYVPDGDDYQECTLKKEPDLSKIWPRTLRLNAHIGLPECVPIRFLAEDNSEPSWFEKMGRRKRVDLNNQIAKNSNYFTSEEAIKKSASSIASMFSSDLRNEKDDSSNLQTEELKLAKKLLCEVANIDCRAFKELQNALENEKDAYVNGMIREMNSALAKKLNFPHWWVQDKDFQLLVSPREFDLVFSIKDRTGSEYAFNERSSGLKYFLSYYIQYHAYKSQKDGASPEILLMDEPDAFLSSQGQQDLLKLFEAFSEPKSSTRSAVQIVYVTHSPFLIDKNHAERIRVLEKGVDDEGTRVVRNVSKNHYEPLRSAFGAFVGETTFIGNCNLVVEGAADQILIAGGATLLRNQGVHQSTLDLNHVTIVPAGSASHVPYIVYLARGRDVVQPAVIVLLDSDEAGNIAAKGLKRGGPRDKKIINSDFVLQIGDLANNGADVKLAPGQVLFELEDLIPLEICQAAIHLYFKNVFGTDPADTSMITIDSLKSRLNELTPTFDAIEAELASLDPPKHIEKMGFARSVLEVVKENSKKNNSADMQQAIANFTHNMTLVMSSLTRMQRAAERDNQKVKVSSKIDRLKDAFIQDHPTSATREDVVIFFEDIEAALDDTVESDEILIVLQQIKREYQLDTEITSNIIGYDSFKERLDKLRYAGQLTTQVIDIEENKSLDSSTISLEVHDTHSTQIFEDEGADGESELEEVESPETK